MNTPTEEIVMTSVELFYLDKIYYGEVKRPIGQYRPVTDKLVKLGLVEYYKAPCPEWDVVVEWVALTVKGQWLRLAINTFAEKFLEDNK